MNLLRWILLIAGSVLIAAIYLWGRRNRRTPDDRPAATVGVGRSIQGHGAIPQLDEPVLVRARAAEPSMAIMSSDTAMDADGLPPMHTGVAPIDTGASMRAASASSATAHDVPVLSSQDDVGLKVATSAARDSAPVRATPPADTAMRSPKKVTSSRKIVALRLSAGNDRVEGARLKSLLEAAGLRHGKYSIYHRLHADGSSLFSVASMVEPGTFDPYAMSGVQFPGVTIFTQLPGPIQGGEMFAQMLACARELEQGIGGLLQDERGLPLTELRAQRLRDDVADFVHLLGQG